MSTDGSVLDRFIDQPFGQALKCRLAELEKSSDRWKKCAGALIDPNPTSLPEPFKGGRNRKSRFLAQSKVTQAGAMVYGTPIEQIAELDAVEIFPLLLLGRRVRPEDRRSLLIEYHKAADASGAFDVATAALKRITSEQDAMKALLSVVLSLSMVESSSPWEQCAIWMGISPWLIANVTRRVHGLSVTYPPALMEFANGGLARSYVTALGMAIDADAASAFVNRYLGLLCSHSVNLSTTAAQNIASGGNGMDMWDPLLAGILSLRQPKHGGAQGTIITMLQQLREEIGSTVSDEAQLKAALLQRLSNRQPIEGVGHAVIRGDDPRAVSLRHFAQQHPVLCRRDDLKFVFALMDLMPAILGSPEAQKIRAINNPHVNVDFVGGPLQAALLKITVPSALPLIFVLARAPDYLTTALHAANMRMAIFREDSIDEKDAEALSGRA